MAKVRDLFQSRFLRADDLGTARVRVTIEQVAIEAMHGSKKPVLYFRGKTKGLVINQTRALSLSRVLESEETDDWVGCQVTIYVADSQVVDLQTGRKRKVPMICVDERPDSALHPRRTETPAPEAGPAKPMKADDVRW